MASDILLQKFQEIEPGSDFGFSLPIVTSSSGKRYYAKAGRPSEQEQYVGEAESLRHIARAAPGLAPRVFDSGIDSNGRPFFISEYLDTTHHSGASMARLATRLATELHAYKSTQGFGFSVPTFCGETRMENGWYEEWEECYDALIGGLQRRGWRSGAGTIYCARRLQPYGKREVIPYLLRPLEVDPVLLHGDLWSGNTSIDKSTSEPVVYDPSSFYGHNEADLAIARIFGGFPKAFFEKYHELLPKSEPADQYEMRVDLYELFHYLNHALIFGGGGYASSASQKMDRLLKCCS